MILMIIITALIREVLITSVRYEYRVLIIARNEVDKPVSLPEEVYIPLPPTIEGWQYIDEIRVLVNGSNVGYKLLVDNDGNFRIYPNLPLPVKIKSVMVLEYYITIRVVRNGLLFNRRPRIVVLSQIRNPQRELLRPLGSWDWSRDDDKWCKLRYLARSLKGNNTLETVLNISRWVLSNIEYGETEVVIPPYALYDRRRGDCADQSSFIVTLLRMLGIPSLIALGFVYDPIAKCDICEYNLRLLRRGFNLHAFVLVFIEGLGWIPLDTTAYRANPIENPLVVISDRLIIGGFVIGSNPNEYETFRTYDQIDLDIRITMKRRYDVPFFILICEAIATLGIYVITRRTYV